MVPSRRPQGFSNSATSPRPLVPAPGEEIPTARVKSVGRHPTIYRKRVEDVDRHAKPGDLLAVYDLDNQMIGYGLFNPRSEIAIRMIRFEYELPDDQFWDELLKSAVQLRRDVLKLDEVTNSYRVIHAEADGLPGLVVDRHGSVLSAEAFSLAMYQRAPEILERLSKLLGTEQTILRTSPASLAQEGFEAEPVITGTMPSRVVIEEFGTRFKVDFAEGHKTGFFCDQRENRKQLASFCKDKTVLDLCCYTGGFAVQAKKLGGASDVIGVDLDEEPLKLAKENANLNQVRCRFVQADAFAYMRDMQSSGRKFDVVVLDPPKLIRSRAEIEEGTRKHFALNRLAMQLVAPGGVMLSCTCAGLLPLSEFLQLIYAAARQAGPEVLAATEEHKARYAARQVQIFSKSGAAADHPVATNCPEGEYLQAVWMRLM